MMKIELTNFGGMAPMVDSTKLQDHFAFDAENVVFNRGVLSQNPLKPELESTKFTADTSRTSGVKYVDRLVYFDDGTIFGFLHDQTQDSNHGVGSLIAPRDGWKRKYFIRNGRLRVASPSAGGSPPLEGGYTRAPDHYELGLDAPTIALTAVSSHVGDPDNDDPVDDLQVAWTYTVVDGFGHESPPAPPSNALRVPFNAGWRVKLSGFDTSVLLNTHYKVGALFRIYRAAFDGASSEFQFVAEVNFGSNQVVYDGTVALNSNTPVTGVALGEEMELIPSTNWDRPPQGQLAKGAKEGPMETVVSVSSNFLAGYYKNYVCYSEFKMPHAWPTQTRFPLNYEVRGMLPLDNGVLIVTDGKPYWGFGADPQSAVPIELDQNYPCLSTRSLVDMGGYGVYATYDGLVAVEQGQAKILTSGHITREDWMRDFNPTSIIAFAAEGRYYFAVGNQWWVFDPADAAGFARVILEGVVPGNVRVVSFDATQDRVIMVTKDNKVYSLAIKESGAMSWDSKTFVFSPVNFSVARVEATDYPLDLVVRQGTSERTYTVADDRPFRLAPGLAKEWGVGIRAEGGRIRKIGIAQSPGEFTL